MKHLIVLLLICAAAFTAHAQSTAFTYQGRLAANGAPYTGFAEMQFALFTAPTGGVAVAASTPALAGVNVSGGLFATSLDFGAAAFPGADRFLEVQVRTNLGAFFILAPRQALTPVPSALFSLGPWVPSGSNLTYTVGNVGVGTTTPAAKLDVRGDIRLGTNGLFAPAGEENLRIVRGYVNNDALKLAGLGFTSTYMSEGEYLITFDPPFRGFPMVTVTVDDRESSFTDIDFSVASLFDPNANSVRIRTRDHSDVHGNGPHDHRFHFIAIGPR